MNYIFGEDKSSFDSFEPCYKFHNISFENKELGSSNSSFEGLKDFEALRNEFTGIFESKWMKYESVSEKANFGEDSESSSDQQSIDLLDQFKPATMIVHYSNIEESHNIAASSEFFHNDSSLIGRISITKISTFGLQSGDSRPKTLDIPTLLDTDKIETVEQTLCESVQLNSDVKRKNRRCGYYRWNRKDDAKMFYELKEAWKLSSINPEDFYDKNCFISNQHLDVLNTLVNRLQWRRGSDTLLKRIRTLSKNQTLSIRQEKTLKRLIQQAKLTKQEISIDNILNLFPGKSVSSIKAYIDQITRSLSA